MKTALGFWVVIFLSAFPAWGSITGLDIGTATPPSPAGSTTVVTPGTDFNVTAGGADIWGPADSFHYSYDTAQVSGDFEAIVLVENLAYVDPWSKAGIMCRQRLGEMSVNVCVYRSGTNGVRMQTRLGIGAESVSYNPSSPIGPSDPIWLKLARQGNVFAAWFAPNVGGAPGAWSGPILKVVPMSDPVYLGLATTSHKNGTSATAKYRKYAVGPLTSFPELAIFDPPGPEGGLDFMGIREVIDNGAITNQDQCYVSLVSGTGTIVDYQARVLNLYDGGLTTRFGGDLDFGVVTQRKQGHGSVDNLTLVARGAVHIPVGGLYTFCVNSDDGFTLQFPGHDFIEIAASMGELFPFANGDALRFYGSRGAADTLGVINLPAGVHPFVLTYHEGDSGSSVEFSAAAGRKTAFDADFQLVGYKNWGTGPVPGLAGQVTMEATKPGAWSGVPIWNLAYARQAYDEGFGNGTLVSATYDAVNHSDPDNYSPAGTFAGDLPFPNHVPGTDDDAFAVKVLGKLDIPQDGFYQIGFNSDDGAAIVLFANIWNSIVADATGYAQIGGDSLINDTVTGWSFTAGEIYLEAGEYSFEAWMFEAWGGSFFELFGRGVTEGKPDPEWHLLTNGGAGIFTDTKPNGLQLVPEVCPFNLIGDLNHDCIFNLEDFAAMAENWMVDCWQTPTPPSCVSP